MRKELLEALKTKFPGVSDAILNRIVEKLAKTVTSSEQVATAVEGVTFQQILESYGDSRATESAQTAVKNYEKQYSLKDGVKVEEKTEKEIDPEKGGDDEVKTLLKSLVESNKELKAEITAIKSGKVTESRKQQLTAITAKLPENLRKGYDRISVDSLSDEEFTTLLGEVTTEVEGIVAQEKSKGAVFGRPTVTGKAGGTGSGNNQEATEAEAQAVVDKLNI